MLQKIILCLALLALLFIGALLAQNSNVAGQSNADNANFAVNFESNSVNANSLLQRPKKHRRNTESCRLISLSDAEKIYRTPMEFSEERDDEPVRRCDYLTYRNLGDDPSPDPLMSTLTKYESIKKARKILRLEREISQLQAVVYGEMSQYSYQTLNKIGDGAWIRSQKGFREIYVRKGKRILTIQIYIVDRLSLLELKRVAKKAVSKL